MARQSISFTTPNDNWLKAQIESEEFTSKSDVVNDLIRKARAQESEIEYIRTKLIAAEESVKKHGWVNKDRDEILADFKNRLRTDGEIQTFAGSGRGFI